jgi:hypothetical protein
MGAAVASRLARLRELSVLVLACLAFQGSGVEVKDPPALRALPFASGEHFTYRVSWMGLPAATGMLQVGPGPVTQGRQALRLLSSAKSSAWLTRFYPVDNHVESLVDAETLAPLHLRFRRREGKRKHDFEVTFDHARGIVLSMKDGEPSIIPIPPGTQDVLSCLYYVRSLPSLPLGSSLAMVVHHDRHNYRLDVQVEAVEKVRGSWGEVEAIRVLVVMPFQGIFLNEGNMRVWLTTDKRHVPVKMQARVMVGSVIAELIEGWHASSPS